MTGLALALRFVVAELGALAALAWCGLEIGGVVGVALACVFVAVVIALWGAFVAPRAPRRLRDPARFALELAIFAAATGALVAVEHPVLASVYAAVAVVTAALTRVWPQPMPGR